MPCFHPLKAFQIGFHESGKPKYKICSYDVQSVYQAGDSWFASPDKLSGIGRVNEYIEIPCGKCVGCRLSYSRDWANRCMLELGYHKQSLFLTLTYNDTYLPRTYYGDPETGEAQEAYTLRKRDLQLFIKRLRKAYDQPLRYFACGEYGSESLRPHYHLIVYGLDLTDLKYYKRNHAGDILYTSEWLSRIWSDTHDQEYFKEKGKYPEYGYAVVGAVTWDSCAYVARYIMKKQKGDAAVVYDQFNIEPEFVLMSRKPGIGKQYYLDRAEEILHNQDIYIATEKGGKSFRPPRYYDRLFDVDYPEEMEKIRLFRRKIAGVTQNNLIRQIDIDYQEYLQQAEDHLVQRTKILDQKRGDV